MISLSAFIYDDLTIYAKTPTKFSGIKGGYRVSKQYANVAASATNTSVTLFSGLSDFTPKYVIIVDPDNSGDLTVKVNGGSVSYPLTNHIVLSQDLSSLTVTNSDTTNANRLEILFID